MSEKSVGHIEPNDDEPAYVQSVAPDPRRLDPLDNPVSWHILDT